MGILKGAMAVRRFRAPVDLKSGWREAFRESLNKLAFRAPQGSWGSNEVQGWCVIDDLLLTTFEDNNRWLFSNGVIVLGLRVAKKVIPKRDFKATLVTRCREWAESRGAERCPAAVKKEIRERLEIEWYDRTIPTSTVIEVAWDTQSGILLIGSTSDKACDRVRKLIHRTFGQEVVPEAPLDWLDNSARVEKLLATTPTVIGGEA